PRATAALSSIGSARSLTTKPYRSASIFAARIATRIVEISRRRQEARGSEDLRHCDQLLGLMNVFGESRKITGERARSELGHQRRASFVLLLARSLLHFGKADALRHAFC